MEDVSRPLPSRGTEYLENYYWTKRHTNASSRNAKTSGLFDKGVSGKFSNFRYQLPHVTPNPNTEFVSKDHDSIFRESSPCKGKDGNYINNSKMIATKPYGQKVIYDKSHLELMYPSQWNSELLSHNNLYSFPTTSGCKQEVPWTKYLSWRKYGQNAAWPSYRWAEWCQVAKSVPYHGLTDQINYTQYWTQQPPYIPCKSTKD